MAVGLTNSGIGERLFITTKTVERHTQNIYLKIGAPPPAVQPRAYAVAKFQASAHDPFPDLLKISA